MISVGDAANALSVNRTEAAKLLARWQQQSWLRRVRRGLYAPVAITDSAAETVLEDSWILAAKLFQPGYVAGATAAHHWDLTDQLFRTVFVYTARTVRAVHQQIKGSTFTVRHLSANKIFGTKPVWHGRTKIQISDVHRTIVDVVRNPGDGGGLRHVADCFAAYLKRSDCEPARLVEYAERLQTGAIFKRLGFLTEWAGGPQSLMEACFARLTQGVVKLDPALPSPRLIRRWRLWIPDSWKPESK